jgi:hypothetical protein
MHTGRSDRFLTLVYLTDYYRVCVMFVTFFDTCMVSLAALVFPFISDFLWDLRALRRALRAVYSQAGFRDMS